MKNTVTNTQIGAEATQLARVKQVVSGLCIMVFPVMLMFGFITHPNILSLAMVTDYVDWTSEWRASTAFHVGHLLVMFAVPPITVSCLWLMGMARGRGAWLGFVGAVTGVFGAFMLAVDKGALTFVLTAFRDLSEDEFAASRPAIEAIFNRDGWLWVTWLFIFLPLGVILQMTGLMLEQTVPRWQGVVTIVGLLLLINPDIEIISTVGALLMCAGFLPLGMQVIRGNCRRRDA